MQVIVRLLTRTQGNCIFRCFQLHDHAGKTLGERVVNVARHSISLLKDGCSLTLLGKFIELEGEHHLMRERLGQFYLLAPISRPVSVTDSNKTANVSSDQKRNGEESFGSFFL